MFDRGEEKPAVEKKPGKLQRNTEGNGVFSHGFSLALLLALFYPVFISKKDIQLRKKGTKKIKETKMQKDFADSGFFLLNPPRSVFPALAVVGLVFILGLSEPREEGGDGL